MRLYLTIMLFLFAGCAEGEAILKLNIFSCKTDSLENFYSINIYKDGWFFKTIELNIDNRL
jgi:hypothetical protein